MALAQKLHSVNDFLIVGSWNSLITYGSILLAEFAQMVVSAIGTSPALKSVALFGCLIKRKNSLCAFLECLVPFRLKREQVDIALAVVLVESDNSELFNLVSAVCSVEQVVLNVPAVIVKPADNDRFKDFADFKYPPGFFRSDFLSTCHRVEDSAKLFTMPHLL